MKSLSRVRLFATARTVARQASLSMEFPRQEYWSGLPFRSSRGSSQPRDQTQLSCTAGRHSNLWATREASKSRLVLTDNSSETFCQISSKQYYVKDELCFNQRKIIFGKKKKKQRKIIRSEEFLELENVFQIRDFQTISYLPSFRTCLFLPLGGC